MEDHPPRTETPVVIETGEDFSLRSKLAMAILGASVLPLVFVTLHAMSEYGRVISVAQGALPDPAVQAAVESARASVTRSMYEYGFLSALLILSALFLADHVIVRPVRILSTWLSQSRRVSFRAVEPPLISSRDEIGVLAHEIEGSIKYFQEVELRQKQISEEKTEFIAVAAHQLRTPLTGIKWVSDALLESRWESHHQELVTQLVAGVARMSRIVEDILNTVRIEEGKFGYSYASTDIVEPLKKLIREMEPLAQARSVHIEYRSDRPVVIAYVDVDKISLAVSNLLSNAIDYTASGGTVTLSIDSSLSRIRVSVSDTGIGISNDDQKHLFTKFYRGGNARQMRPDGSGLGLYIAQNITRMHGSDISVRSQVGKGTTFSFMVPKEKTDFGPEQPTVAEFFAGV